MGGMNSKAAIGTGVAVAFSFSGGPDYGAITKNRDCGAAMQPADRDGEGIAVRQQPVFETLTAGSMLGSLTDEMGSP